VHKETRYDKLLANFMGFVKLAAIAIWLKWLNRHYGQAAGTAISPNCMSLSTEHPAHQASPARGQQMAGRRARRASVNAKT
jgi:hypothetical protein